MNTGPSPLLSSDSVNSYLTPLPARLTFDPWFTSKAPFEAKVVTDRGLRACRTHTQARQVHQSYRFHISLNVLGVGCSLQVLLFCHSGYWPKPCDSSLPVAFLTLPRSTVWPPRLLTLAVLASQAIQTLRRSLLRHRQKISSPLKLSASLAAENFRDSRLTASTGYSTTLSTQISLSDRRRGLGVAIVQSFALGVLSLRQLVVDSFRYVSSISSLQDSRVIDTVMLLGI